MPRELTRNARDYDPGVYEFSVDSFTRDDTEKLQFVMTSNSWPPVVPGQPIMWIRIAWDNGLGSGPSDVTGPATEKGTGVLTDSFSYTIDVPRNGAGEKVAVVGGVVTVELLVPIRCALTLRAI